MSIPNTAKTHQVKIKDKIFLQFLSCINSLSFRKDLKHLYLFTEERFWPVTIQLCAFRAYIFYIFPFQNLLYYFLKQLSFSRWKKEKKKKKTTIVWHFAPQCAISQKCWGCYIAESYFSDNIHKINTSKSSFRQIFCHWKSWSQDHGTMYPLTFSVSVPRH